MTLHPRWTQALFLPLALTAALAAAQAGPADWPQWRGPDRTGLSRETGLLKAWPPEGPRLLWKAVGLGEGHTSPSVAGDRVYGMGLRDRQSEVVWALDARTGRELWSTPIAGLTLLRGQQGGYGPRSTPTVDGDRVYALGVGGDLVCLERATGRLLWKKSLVRDFGGSVPTWGYSESPLVDGDRVVATPGGSRATLVALDKLTGETIWESRVPGGDAAEYASAIVADVGGVRQYIQFTKGGVIGVAARDGRFLWRNTHAAGNTANCSTPVYSDGHVFAAAGYGRGGALIRIERNADGFAATTVYTTQNMRNHHGGMVLVGDFLYGFDESNLTCLDFRTGQLQWQNRSVGKGSVIYADGHLYARSERGAVALVEATPRGYVEKGRFTQPDRSAAPSWPYPVVAGGRLYLRDQDVLLCYNLKP